MKRGEVASQVFVYAAAMIITALIVLFGYIAYDKIQSHAEKAILTAFQSEFQKDINTLSNKYKNLDIKTYRLDNKVEKVCFIDHTRLGSNGQATSLMKSKPLIWDSINSSTANVFLFKTDGMLQFFESRLRIPSDPHQVCVRNDLRGLSVTMQGGGGVTSILAKLSDSIELDLDSDNRTRIWHETRLDDPLSLKLVLKENTKFTPQARYLNVSAKIGGDYHLVGSQDRYDFEPKDTLLSQPMTIEVDVPHCNADWKFYTPAENTILETDCDDENFRAVFELNKI